MSGARPLAQTAVALRVFAPGDEAQVIALWHACGLVVPWNDPASDIAAKLAFQPELFFVAAEDERVTGTVMAGYDGHRGSIFYLAVAPERRGTGLGRALMVHAERALRALGCPKINLQVRGSNTRVAGFYEKLGYQPDDPDALAFGKRLDGRRRG